MGGLYPGDATWLDSAGRLLICGFFVAVFLRNMTGNQIQQHIGALAHFKCPFPAAAFWMGETLSLVGVALVLFNFRPAIGVLCLMLFIILATALLLRFWEESDPGKNFGMQNGFLANIAIFGGLLLLLQNVR
jgi:uncharacterized membrane protein YphA (DoxX/SURF4 family)